MLRRTIKFRQLIKHGKSPLPTALSVHLMLLLSSLLTLAKEVQVQLKAVRDEMEDTPGAILGKRITALPRLDRCIKLGDDGRRDKNRGTVGELDNDAKIPQDEVAASLPVKWTKTNDAAPTVEEVARVKVWEGDGVRTEVESGSGPNSLFKVPVKGGVRRIKFVYFRLVVVLQSGGEQFERT